MAIELTKWGATLAMFLFVFLGWPIMFFVAIALSVLMIHECRCAVNDPGNHLGYRIQPDEITSL